jgi:hypothetical protein
MSTDPDRITDLLDFLRSQPDDWNLEAIGDEAEQEAVFNQLHGIRHVQREGNDYAEYSGVEEVFGPEGANQVRQPWQYEAERRFKEILERYELVWGRGYEIVVRRCP